MVGLVVAVLVNMRMIDRSTVMEQLQDETYMQQLHALAEPFDLPVIALKSGPCRLR